jgi:hypothetical protein
MHNNNYCWMNDMDFLKTQKEKGAVEIDGKKWVVSYRFAFPSEPVWLKAFRQEE